VSVASGLALGLFGIAGVSMLVYAFTGARRDPDADRKHTQFVLGRGDFLLHWLLWFIGPLERGALRLALTPDAFNAAAVVFGAFAGILIAGGHLGAAGWAIAAGGLCDMMDGRIARAQGVSSAYGTFIDSTLDRFAEAFVLLGFVVFLGPLPAGPFTAAGALAGSMLVSYTRARGESLGVLCKAGLMRRGERLSLLFLICLLDSPVTTRFGWPRGAVAVWGLALLGAGTFVTAVHRTLWISRRLREGGPFNG
jgi:CDP-diacylglycerol--glycerol-3-phosphate 3-phosphatidyltransferase